MLAVAIAVKLIAEIALLALLGQGMLGWLAGARKDRNIFYQVLRIVTRPFVSAARFLAPKVVLDRHLPLVAFLLLAFVWLGATMAKIELCLKIGVALCK
jgi:hypothetical protein